MPAHRKHFENNAAFQASQRTLQYFINNNFWLFVENQFAHKDIEIQPKYIIASQKHFATKQIISSLEEGFDFITSLISKLNSTLKITTSEEIILQGEWNYLGQNHEREAYLQTIKDLFWIHQDKEELQNHSKFQEMMEHPWKLVTYGTDFDFALPNPSDYFEESTIQFVEKILHRLSNWEINPFLITNSESNFHWNIKLNHQTLIEGNITKSEEGELIHITQFR